MKKYLYIIILASISAFGISCSSNNKGIINPPNGADTSMQGVWVQIASLPTYGRQGAVSFSIGNYAYAGLGFTSYFDSVFAVHNAYPQDFWRYDPATNSWTRMADFPGTGRNYAVAFSINGIGYVGTGYERLPPTMQNLGGDTVLKDFYAYDPATNSWTKKADFAGIARGGAVGFTINGNGYIGLGINRTTIAPAAYPNDFYQYTPATDSWTQVADFPTDGRIGAAAFAYNNAAYVFAGSPSAGSGSQSMYSFDGNKWTTANSNVPSGFAFQLYLTPFVAGNSAYVVGGSNNSSVGAYDIAGNKWKILPEYPEPSPSGGAAFTINGAGYAGMGLTGDLYKEPDSSLSSYSNHFYRFYPDSTLSSEP